MGDQVNRSSPRLAGDVFEELLQVRNRPDNVCFIDDDKDFEIPLFESVFRDVYDIRQPDKKNLPADLQMEHFGVFLDQLPPRR